MGIFRDAARRARGFAREARFKSAQDRAQEASLYAEAMSELERGERDKGLWAKALAESDGDEQKATARYLKLRVVALKDFLQVGEDMKASVEDELERDAEAQEAARKAAEDRQNSVPETEVPFNDDLDSTEPSGCFVATLVVLVVVFFAWLISLS